MFTETTYGRWWVTYYNGSSWQNYDYYNSKWAAEKTAIFLQSQGNQTKVFWH